MGMAEHLQQFEALIEGAIPVPLTADVRVDRYEAADLVELMRGDAPAELSELVVRLDKTVGNAKAVPLTDQIRLHRAKVWALLDAMRAGLDLLTVVAGVLSS
jgi:hypothetical protein